MQYQDINFGTAAILKIMSTLNQAGNRSSCAKNIN